MTGLLASITEPFTYDYMWKAMWVSGLVGAAAAFLSCYLMLKGWSLMGDALGHAVVPGVAVAYLMAWPYAAGAFIAGLLAAFGMHLVKVNSRLREDAVIGIVFTTFFATGLLIASLYPTSVDIQSIVLGNILAIGDAEARQVAWIAGITLVVMLALWKDLMAVFFDESHARSIGLPATALRIVFFTLLAATTVAALQTVGACLVIATVITPGATAYLLTDRFPRLLQIAVGLGATTGFLGAYISYFVNGATGGVIVTLQTLIFLAVFVLAPKHGRLAQRRRARTGASADPLAAERFSQVRSR
ncbi:MAG: metal ABC transporter permease [Hyphomicrobiaceae bacterium]